ncbi:MAG: Crp/Fnr family transcriptional regulator [Bacteroidia bacterium]|nr:Crp/Fnr family transcriptional regulator [Bacteroidia bacterium]
MELKTGIELFKNFLQKNTLFDEEAFNKAVPFMKLQHISKNALFVEEGKMCWNFGFILSGLMRSFFNEEGNEITTCFCKDNAIASSTSGFITQTPSPINVQALDDTYLLIIPFDELKNLFLKYPFWSNVGRLIAEREFLYTDCLHRCYSHQQAIEKYLQLLTDMPGIINQVPLQYIASFLGIRPETLSRIRKKTARRIS